MCRLEAIDGNSVITSIDGYGEIFVRPFDDWIRSIIWWLQGSAYAIMADENMSGCGK